VGEGARRLAGSNRGRGLKPRSSDLSAVNTDRLVTIAEGEMYPDWGIRERLRATRSRVDKSSFPNIGKEMSHKSGSSTVDLRQIHLRTDQGGSGRFPRDTSSRLISSGNGLFIAAIVFNSEFGTPLIKISHTRCCCLSTAVMLATPRNWRGLLSWSTCLEIGKSGQISSLFFTGLLFVQRSCRSNQRGEENTTCRHRWHT